MNTPAGREISGIGLIAQTKDIGRMVIRLSLSKILLCQLSPVIATLRRSASVPLGGSSSPASREVSGISRIII